MIFKTVKKERKTSQERCRTYKNKREFFGTGHLNKKNTNPNEWAQQQKGKISEKSVPRQKNINYLILITDEKVDRKKKTMEEDQDNDEGKDWEEEEEDEEFGEEREEMGKKKMGDQTEEEKEKRKE